MINLKDETVKMLESIGKLPEDVIFVQTGETQCSYSRFLELADFEYDSGFGGNNVDTSLCTLFRDNTWLSRDEYVGSEWWEFNQFPLKTIVNELMTKQDILENAYV